MIQDLMPVSTEAPRCSEFAQTIGLLPLGTGLFLTRAVIATVALPWPKPALNHPALRLAGQATAASAVPSRLFACEPIDGLPAVVEVYERDGATSRLYRWVIESPEVVEALAGAIASAEVGSLAAVTVPGAELDTAGHEPGPTFLVCTQGTHDMCCGVSGVILADELDGSRPDFAIRRVSHTGGHRFAPTLLAFPEGRMWAFADRDLIDRIATSTETPEDFARSSRGWWGAKVGPAQVAEGAVRATLAAQNSGAFEEPNVARNDAEGTPTQSPGPDGGESTFQVTVGDRAWRVTVVVARNVPTIACEAPGGLPAKPAREFGWSVEPVATPCDTVAT